MEVFNRLNDSFVKFLFANPKNKPLLIEFLNEVLSDVPAGVERIAPIVDIEYADREIAPEFERDKMPRFDVIARTSDGRLFHIEIQLEGYENILPRTLNYASRDYSGLTGKGEDYSSKRVIRRLLSRGISIFTSYNAKKQGVRQRQSVYTLLFDTYKALIVIWLMYHQYPRQHKWSALRFFPEPPRLPD